MRLALLLVALGTLIGGSARVDPNDPDAGPDAGSRADGMEGSPCWTTADCDPVANPGLVCSYTVAGCGVAGTCNVRRMCLSPMTFCGCDGRTFSNETCYEGIAATWVHEGPCEIDAGDDASALAEDAADHPSCQTSADCPTGLTCLFSEPGCAATGTCWPVEDGCGWIDSGNYCGCNGETIHGGCAIHSPAPYVYSVPCELLDGWGPDAGMDAAVGD